MFDKHRHVRIYVRYRLQIHVNLKNRYPLGALLIILSANKGFTKNRSVSQTKRYFQYTMKL